MTAELPAIDRDKRPPLDADHDPARIADALRGSPHIRFVAAAEPGTKRSGSPTQTAPPSPCP